MSGAKKSSKNNNLVKFNDDLSDSDYLNVDDDRLDVFIDGRLCSVAFHAHGNYVYLRIDSDCFDIWECEYQICLRDPHGKVIVLKGRQFTENEDLSDLTIPTTISVLSWNEYSINIQAKVFTEYMSGVRMWNFQDNNIYGESKRVQTLDIGLEIPVESVKIRAPKLAATIQNKDTLDMSHFELEAFLQILHGVHVQLRRDQFKPLLKLAVKYEVFTVKRYCEQQLIWTDDLRVSKKYRIARKFKLIHLMNHVLRAMKTSEEIVELVCKNAKIDHTNGKLAKAITERIYELN